MRLVVVLEHRFVVTPDGRAWTRTNYGTTFWHRYLTAFDTVAVVARAVAQPSVHPTYRCVNGPGVEFVAVPYYVGPYQYLQRRVQVRARLHGLLAEPDAFLCRVGSQLASDLLPAFWRAGRPYGLEVVGDPYDLFSPGAIRHPLRPFFRHWATRNLKLECARAGAVSYVTTGALQRRYPGASEAVMYAASDVELPAGDFRDAPRRFGPEAPSTRERSLLFVGSLAQLYKAPDVLIRAVHLLAQAGRPVRLTIVGDGRHRLELERLVRSLSVEANVTFLGELPSGAAIRDQLDRAALFVLPSRQEGLPRALVEAMARALPSIGTTVGGIPELLEAEDLVPLNDAGALADKIDEVLSSPERLTRMSARNLKKTQEFRTEALERERTRFYRDLRARTEAWLASGSGLARTA